MSLPFCPATGDALPVFTVSNGDVAASGAPQSAFAWAGANGWKGKPGEVLVTPGENGAVSGALFGAGDGPFGQLATGALATRLPAGNWRLAGEPKDAELAALGFALGAYRFERYLRPRAEGPVLAMPADVDAARLDLQAKAVWRVRDLVNTPANDMGPQQIEDEARAVAARFGAAVHVTTGDDLLAANFPMIHAVGRASAQAPRLIDLVWGREDAPKVTLVGKGVCFDTGGLDIKPSTGMRLMKKDMGGAANVLGLATMIMALKLPVRLRVLIPAVENAISGSAFRPGDVLATRKGLTVENGNTDAEGRLILSDALALADEEEPDLLVDMATLTGAARMALGPDLPPFYTADDAFASQVMQASGQVCDPVWRMPLWQPYAKNLASRIADMSNVTTDGFAGSVTAALFLQRFVEKARVWAHFDIFAWTPVARPHAPVGGEAQAIRALLAVVENRYPA